jgi:dipeptidase E
MEPRDPTLDDAALALTGKDTPKVCFLGTANGDASQDLDAFYAAFPQSRARACHVSLFHRRRDDLASRILGCDLLYIGGGNTANLRVLWRLHGVDALVGEAWRSGVVLAGVSAGASVLFEACLTDAFGASLTPLSDGLGLVPGSFCPHYNRGRRRSRFRQVIGEGVRGGFGVGDGAALHFHGTELKDVFRERPDCTASRVSRESGKVREVAL